MTRATNERPTRRLMESGGDEYVVELIAGVIIIRPKGSRRNGPAAIYVTPGQVYVRALQVRVDKERAEKRKARKSRKART